MTDPKPSILDQFPEPQSYDGADVDGTELVRAARDAALAEPRVAAVVEAKTQILRNRAHTLSALRKARGLTQMQLSEELGMSQGEISRLERRENLHLATLARFIEATGGELRLTVVYEDDEVVLSLGQPGPD